MRQLPLGYQTYLTMTKPALRPMHRPKQMAIQCYLNDHAAYRTKKLSFIRRAPGTD